MAYVGQSSSMLERRMKEHKRAIERGNIDRLAVAGHVWSSEHSVNYEAVEVL